MQMTKQKDINLIKDTKKKEESLFNLHVII